MRTLGPTFLSLQVFPQHAIRQNQSALAKAQLELSTQRHSDVSLHLSNYTGRNIRWHSELTNMEDSIRANELHEIRADVTQASLQSVSTLASDFLRDLIGSRGAEGGRKIIQNQAENAMSMLRDALNVDVDGVFLFAGRNQTTPPVVEFTGSAAEVQFETIFQAEFGIQNSDPAIQFILPSQIINFLSGSFETLFNTPNWETTLSNATSENVLARVNAGENIDLLANANEQPIRDLFNALISMSKMAVGNLNDASFDKLVDAAATKVSSAVQGLADMQARVGINQKSLEDASDQLKSRKTWLNEAILKTESVDPYEVATRMNRLMTQLEASYSVTSRISRISLLNYL